MFAITEVTLRNFRGFENVEGLRLAPLTFLVGPNSSGKSSIADALLFMAQSGLLSLQATNPIWSGPLVDLGSFKDTVFRHDTKRAIEIGLQIDATVIRQRGRRLKREPISAVVSAQVEAAEHSAAGRGRRRGAREARRQV
jgi:predicted ATP-dependent endonuclease of OLD family